MADSLDFNFSSLDSFVDVEVDPNAAKWNAIYGMAQIPNSTRVAVSSQDGVFAVWDTVTGALVYSVNLGSGDNGRASSLDVSPDGRWVALSTGFKVRLFDASSGEEMQMDNSRGHRGWVRDLCFSHDGHMIASVGEDKKIILWDVESRTVSKRMDAHSAGIYCVDFSHDDTRLVTGSADVTICQWSVETGKLIGKPLVGHQGLIKSVHYSNDDSRILSASADKTACIWDVEGNIIQQFVGASSYINDAIWSESEEEVITVSNDKYVRIWCVANGKETARLEGHFGGVSRLSLSEDGERLMSSDYIGGVKVWEIPSLSTLAGSLSEKYSQR